MQTEQTLSIEKIRNDFPILKDVIYLDSSATSLTPNQVIEKLKEFYQKYNSNVHRGIYKISQKATEEYELAHQKVADFINAKFEEIIFTKSTTESINLLAYSLIKTLSEGDEIVLTEMEHHSNLVPWQQLAKEKGIIVKYIPVTEDYKLDLESAKQLITDKTKIVSVTHMSNVLATINPIKELAQLAHDKNAILIVDAAQSVPHIKVDVKDLDVDFLAFSGHKMLGPTGIGILYGKKNLLENLSPFLYGGDMVSEVTFEDSKWNELPWKFEAGTPNIAQGLALGTAIDYYKELGFQNIQEYEEELTNYTLEKLSTIQKITIYRPKSGGPVISFNLDGIHPHDVSTILDRQNIAIRGGHMCAMPLVDNILNAGSVCRVSLSFYNTKEEIDQLIIGLKKAQEIFKKWLKT